MRRQDLEKSIHLKNDGFTIRCDIAIVTDFNLGDAGAAMRFVVVPPADIQNHLYNLLLSQEGADVTFQVGDEKFAAHRCVLAARSAVFKAELFGPMKEGTTDTVAIDDSPFRLLLVFIYCDSIPEFEEEEEEFMLQHLLVAADKYDVPRLRLMCGQKLCRCINTDTVPTILELAEQHHCQGLKDACLDFLSSLANLQEVTAAGGLDNLTSSSPSD
jgi:speckle-type POZ protein